MTHRTNARPAGLGRAEAIVAGGLSLLVVAVLVSWLGGSRAAPLTVTPSTQPVDVLEPEPLMTAETQIAIVDSASAVPTTLPATQPAAFYEGEARLLPTD